MEYPFKDLLPLDEVLAREGYYKDWTHLDPEVFYSLTQISEYIKTKGYGVDVRLLIAQLAEHFGLKTTQVVDLANLLQQKFTNLEGVTQSFTSNINSLVAQMEADKNTIVANATVDSEVILARGGKATLGQRLDETTAQLEQIAYNLKSHGAIGDGITDDTLAIKQANDYLYNRTRLDAEQHESVMVNKMKLFLPRGIYRVKGDKVFGSPLIGESPHNSRIQFELEGDNAVILWDLESEDDRLFNFDHSINAPIITGITIMPVSEDNTIKVGGNIFNYHSISGGASKTYMDDVRVFSGRSLSSFGFSTRPKNIFNITGTTTCDLGLIQNCSFSYFNTFFHSDNGEAVGWTFQNNNYYGGDASGSTYFNIKQLSDTLNIKECTFSFTAGETFIKTDSPIGVNGLYTQSSFFNINLDNNRYEFHLRDGYSEFIFCDMNFGRLNMTNSNLKLGKGSSLTKTVFKAYGMANFNFNNIVFNANTSILLPIATTPAFSGGLSAYGALFKGCDFTRDSVTIEYTNGTEVFTIKEAMLNSNYYRHFKVENCTFTNSNGFIDFEIVNSKSHVSDVFKTERTMTLSKSGRAIGETFRLPPFQVIKSIKLSNFSTVPATYNVFRIYFGDKTLNNFIDVDNPNPDTIIKQDFPLFVGSATIFNDDWNSQTISVYVLNNGVESSAFVSELVVTYVPLDIDLMQITSVTDQIVVKEKSDELNRGTTANRPNTPYIGMCYFDTSITRPIWWDGSTWRDSQGVTK